MMIVSRKRGRGEEGQAMVLTVLFMVGLLGMAALVLDVGSWFRSSRAVQATADAAALAGAQALPGDPGTATSLAVQYANKNGGGLDPGGVTISSDLGADDTISVTVTRSTSSFFGKLFGFGDVGTPQRATARAQLPGEALYVAPVTVNRLHPMLGCNPPPCTGATEIDLLDQHHPGSGNAAGAFTLLNLDPANPTGSVGESTLASWMNGGMNKLMPLGTYTSVPSAMFNGSEFQAALAADVGRDVLFPVFNPPIVGSGSNAQYNIIGWVGFHVTGSQIGGSSGKIFGNFTSYIAQGIQATSAGEPDFGVRTIQLVH